MEAVAGSFRVHSTDVAADDEPVVVHDGFDSVVVAIDAAASLVVDDDMEEADGSLDLPDDSSMEVAQSNYRGCSATAPAGTVDDRNVANDAVKASCLLRIDSVVAAAAALVVLVVVDSAPDLALASVNSALPVVVPCFVVDTADAAAVAAADGEDGGFRCYRPRGHPRPLMRHCWGRLCHRLAVVRLVATVQSPAEERSAAESVLAPSRLVRSWMASPRCLCPCCACQEPSVVGAFQDPSSLPLYSWYSLAV